MAILAHPGFARRIEKGIVYLRRYARALTGSQVTGDALTDLVRDGLSMPLPHPDVKIALFRAFHDLVMQLPPDPNLKQDNSREVLLLRCLEGFAFPQIAEILRISEAKTNILFEGAFGELKAMRPYRIMLIEDEFLIAMQMTQAITEFGHSVVGVARTRAEAIFTANDMHPELIISDIALADGSSGIDAIDEISLTVPHVAVIYLTGYPERLLTGNHREPAFVLEKPYREKQMQSSIAQALKMREADLGQSSVETKSQR